MRKRILSYLPLLVFLVLACSFFWPLALMQDSLKWDALDAFLPWRRAVTESLRAGHLPLWNPFQYLGFPLHSDPECGAWYPMVWIIALFRNYDFYTQNLEFCFHIFIAGYGTFVLARSLGQHIAAAFVAGICYMSCGFFVGNAQNFIFLIGPAWFPLALFYLRRALILRSRAAALKTGLVFYLILSGSYPGASIIALYGLAGYALYFWITRFRIVPAFNKQYGKMLLWIALPALAFSAVVWVSVYEALPYFSRAGGISYELVSENSFSPKAFISFLLPFATSGLEAYDWGSGNCMINAYMGLIPLLLIFEWAISGGKTKKEWLLLITAILLMGLAMGPALPLRYWLFRFVPGMDLFRHTSIFRVFALLAFMLLGGFRLSRMLEQKDYHFRNLKICLALLLLVFVIILIASFPPDLSELYSSFWEEYMQPTGFWNLDVSSCIFIQSQVQVVIILMLLVCLFVVKKPLRILPFVVAIDMFLAVQLNMPSTVTFALAQNPLAEREQQLLDATDGERPYNNQHISDNEPGKLGVHVEGLWRNLNIFCKQPYYKGYNSFQFTSFNTYENSRFFSTGMKNKLVYLSDTCYPIKLMEDSVAVAYHPQNLYAAHAMIQHHLVPLYYGKGNVGSAPPEVTIRENEIDAVVELKNEGLLTLLQNYHKNWKVTVDDQDRTADLFVTNHTLMSLALDKGQHCVRFIYTPLKTLIAFWISVLAAGVSLLALLWISYRKRHF